MLAGASVAGGPFLFSWGSNGGVGKLGQNDIVDRSSPTQVGTTNNWAQVSAGATHSAVVTPNGEIYAWGNNNVGVLGLNDTVNRSSPTQVGGLTNWSQGSAGQNMCVAVKTDGTLWSWGYRLDNSGQLGLNDDVTRSSPTQVGGLANWAEVKATNNGFCVARKTDGTLWAWGNNGGGQLGQNNTTKRSSPVQVGSLTTWSQVSAGGQHCAAIKTDGTLWTWGNNAHGFLGLNDTTYRSSPVQVGALTNWSKVSAGGGGCMVIKTDGTLWIWGRGSSGRLGLNDIDSRSSPVQVGSLTNWSQVAAGMTYFSTAIQSDGEIYAWGVNGSGRLGQNDLVDRSSPTQIGSLTNWQTSVNSISAGDGHCVAIQN